MHCYAVIFAQNWQKPMKKRKNKNDWLTIMYYLSILYAHTNASSLRYEHAYRITEAVKPHKHLKCYVTIRKNFILYVAGFLDLPLVIEKIDLNLKIFCCTIVKEMAKLLNVTLERSLFADVFSALWLKVTL